MTKLYTEYSSDEMKNLKPKKETIIFLLNYSKALNVTSYKNMKFDRILN